MSSSAMASNAILAKARAMYGKCLTDSDYKQLMDCRNVSEVASYLKSRTSYKSALTGLDENDVHRGQLEPMLKQNIYFDVFALSRYAKDKALVFSDFIISEMEIEQIMRCLMLVNIGRSDEYVYTMPLSLDKFTKISLKKLTGVRTYDDLADALYGSKYHAVLQKHRPKDGERINIAQIEADLNNQNYAIVMKTIENGKNKSDRDELRDVLAAMLDFRNISSIIRLKKYYKYDQSRIKPLLIPYGRLAGRTLDELCAAESVQEVFEISRSTYLGRLMSKLRYNDQSQMTSSMISMYCRHHLRLSPNPTIVMVSYIYLKEIELKNIINIIEATRYGLSAEEKAKLLVR